MELILWRHAEAHDGSPDAERKLTAKGKRHAKRVANWLRKRLPKGVRIVASPAARTQRTARELSRRFETVAEVGLSARAEGLLKAAGWPDASDTTVVIVGHQPTLGEAAALALTGRAAPWSLQKGALIWIKSSDDGDVILIAAISPDLA
ncbi:MAG: histidine phosphatase family protein [Proteobacteria bacterium]|nr:histidine phosphatase family protein [Pseudomonadota bacterium]MDA0983491.1 histidine phosphatase family protein [Pseudomonadota bacterium]